MIKLGKYREEYKLIKIVEMDLAKDIHILDLLYRLYWKEKNFVSFEKFYRKYLKEKKTPLEIFRKKIQMCKRCFYRGLPARTFRTWMSILTQIQGGYVAEDIFGIGTVQMSEELDRKGADIRINYKNRIINCQIKKKSFSREVRQEKRIKRKLPGKWINIKYFVPGKDVLDKPKKLNGEFKKSYKRFKKYKYLKCLPNGFVIFTDKLSSKLK